MAFLFPNSFVNCGMKATVKPYLPPHMRKQYKYIFVGGNWVLYRKTGVYSGSTL